MSKQPAILWPPFDRNNGLLRYEPFKDLDNVVFAVQAANAYPRLIEEREKLIEALRVFADVPTHGTSGGPLVCAEIFFEDGSSGKDLGISPKFSHSIPHEAFTKARVTLASPEKDNG